LPLFYEEKEGSEISLLYNTDALQNVCGAVAECVNKNETLNGRKIELKKAVIQGAPALSSKSRGNARLPPSPFAITRRV